ncbi:hypothetical protein COS54_00035 [Candidatus Shapirobacteria bacterium CG03_land_8_20_14_0_80_39_12]|uniref:Type II secretion system protein GspF domain-containing protein n=1 Tax=Candidatus Shapirobacteria bacterium CG03_land_8_20_14_0_80_39_12 TaxID=1974879 RepID=A0A2M7BG95_9BACT|nr:MAG: hypothetical protein COS54_00035 [Candidatus Shapirobacteria bacterium CG03_land_8_20_14_0_80_39_12]
MLNFSYKAKDQTGKEVKGLVEAQDKKQALTILHEKQFTPFFIKEEGENFLGYFYNKFVKKVSQGEVAVFTRQIATMINAGLPLTEALTILSSQGKGLLQEAIGVILRDVEGGSNLADALQKHPKIFSPVYIALVRAGESAGVLDNILTRLADNLEAQREFNSKIKGALTYPIIILVGMGGVIFIMMVFVIPKLTVLYTEFNAKLPKATQILITFSSFAAKFWWLIILVVVGLAYVFRILNKNRDTKRKLDELKFKIPIYGKLQNQIVLAEFTRTLGLLVGAGVSIVEALQISSKTASNIKIEEGILEASKQVEKGFPLSVTISTNPFFPKILSQMLTVGEETGKVDEVLLKVAKFFQSESDESLKGLTSAIEPLIMVIMGVGVGFLAIAIILPIYNLTSAF